MTRVKLYGPLVVVVIWFFSLFWLMGLEIERGRGNIAMDSGDLGNVLYGTYTSTITARGEGVLFVPHVKGKPAHKKARVIYPEDMWK